MRYNHLCLDCRVDTFDAGEMYMVHDELWERVVGDKRAGMLCVGCFEARLGRYLTPADFTDAPLNWCPMSPEQYHQSGRLQARLRIEL